MNAASIIAAMNMTPSDRDIFEKSPGNCKSNAELKRHTELIEEYKCRAISEESGRSYELVKLTRKCHRIYGKTFSRIRCNSCGRLVHGGRLFGLFGLECEPCNDANAPKRSAIDWSHKEHYNPDDPRPWPNRRSVY